MSSNNGVAPAAKKKTKKLKIRLFVGPQNGRATRKVVARWKGKEFTDVLDTDKAAARDSCVRRLAKEWGLQPERLNHLKPLLVQKAQEMDDQVKQAAEEGADERAARDIPYKANPGGLVYEKPSKDGVVEVALTNFDARIVNQVAEDDGVEVRRLFEIEARRGQATYRFTVPAGQFAGMNWVPEHLGGEAVVLAGMGVKDHARVGVQLLSGKIPEERVFTHSGWREVGGNHVFLHADGAIGDYDVDVSGIRVRLPEPLANFSLPKPNMGDRLIEAIRAALRLLDLAPPALIVPLLAAVFRAVLGGTDFSLFLAGPTGVFKSELAALFQRFFGRRMDARHLPTNWATTANANEDLAFHAKDVVLGVDDFAPGGGQFDVAKLHKEADRLLRGQGNSAGRGRMRRDSSLRPQKWPRGLILGTGEDVPKGQSLRARILVQEVSPDDVDVEELTACQKDAGDGAYALVLAGFLRWLAGQYGPVQKKMRTRVEALRAEAAASGQHRRTPGIVADLHFGLELFAEFAVDVAALTRKEADKLLKRGWEALGEAAAAQQRFQAGSDPVRRFKDLLAAALAAGRAHVADKDGKQPGRPEIWGWRHQEGGWQPRGDRIGWVDGNSLYLEPEVAFTVAQRLAQEGGEPLTVGSKTLHKRLHEDRLLKTVDKQRGHLTVRPTLEGKSRYVLHVSAKLLGAPPVAAVPGS